MGSEPETGVKRVSATGAMLIADGGDSEIQNFKYVERGHIVKGALSISDWKRLQLYDDYIGMQTRITEKILGRK